MNEKYTVKQAMETLDIARATLFNRIAKYSHYLEENNHVSMVKGKKYIDSVGLEIIRNNKIIDNLDSNTNNDVANDKEVELLKKDLENAMLQLNDKINDKSNEVESLKQQLQDKHEYIKLFQNQLEIKDNQLETKDKQIEELNNILMQSQKLNENNQIIIRESQQKVLKLENQEQKQDGFFKRLFNN